LLNNDKILFKKLHKNIHKVPLLALITNPIDLNRVPVKPYRLYYSNGLNHIELTIKIKVNELLDINQLKVTSGLQTLKNIRNALSFQ